MIELSQTSKISIKFGRMIPSGSSWLMGLKTQRLVGQAHAVIEPGKSIPICDTIPSTTPGADPPRDAKDSGSARSHPTHLETSSSNRP